VLDLDNDIFDDDLADWIAHSGWRDPAEQNKDYAQGRTTPGPIITDAPAGHSPHDTTPALAVDFHKLSPDGKDSWTVDDDWKRIMAKVDAHPRLHGGWHFPTPDNDHIQSTRWYQVRSQLKAQGKW
jgi:hypothetical protein